MLCSIISTDMTLKPYIYPHSTHIRNGAGNIKKLVSKIDGIIDTRRNEKYHKSDIGNIGF